MADSLGGEFRNEYVELMNPGNRPRHLGWWILGGGMSSDTLIFASQVGVDQRQICLMVDPDHSKVGRPYVVFSEGVIIATVADQAIA